MPIAYTDLQYCWPVSGAVDPGWWLAWLEHDIVLDSNSTSGHTSTTCSGCQDCESVISLLLHPFPVSSGSEARCPALAEVGCPQCPTALSHLHKDIFGEWHSHCTCQPCLRLWLAIAKTTPVSWLYLIAFCRLPVSAWIALLQRHSWVLLQD